MPLSADDGLAIQNLYADYNFAIDFGDADAWAATFVADGSLDPGHGDPTAGTAALVEFAAATQSMLPGGRHLVTNVSIDGDGDRATGRCYLQLWNTAGGSGSTSLIISGVYHDVLSKTADGWRFVSRALTPDA